jgi:Leucine-rich repeat (LRR) protein
VRELYIINKSSYLFSYFLIDMKCIQEQFITSFNGSSNLECLKLDNIHIDLAKSDPFVNMTKLRQITMSLSTMENVELDFFQKFPNLEKLDLYYTSIPFSAEHLTNLINLKFLSLIGNCCSELDSLKEISNLVILEFDFKTACPIEEFKCLKQLEHLRIHAKPGLWMRHLKKLKSLALYELSSDKILNVDHHYSFMTSLCKLEIISSNCEHFIQRATFTGLKQLNVLSLKNITIADEDGLFEDLENLTELNLSMSNRTELTIKSNLFKSLRKLRKLTIYRVAKIETNFLEYSSNLSELKIGYVFQSFEITERTFSKQRDLKVLEICVARISSLPANVFVNLSNLTRLSFFGNCLRTLNENSFNGLDNVRELKINPFNTNILSKMPKLKILCVNEKIDSDDLLKTQYEIDIKLSNF